MQSKYEKLMAQAESYRKLGEDHAANAAFAKAQAVALNERHTQKPNEADTKKIIFKYTSHEAYGLDAKNVHSGLCIMAESMGVGAMIRKGYNNVITIHLYGTEFAVKEATIILDVLLYDIVVQCRSKNMIKDFKAFAFGYAQAYVSSVKEESRELIISNSDVLLHIETHFLKLVSLPDKIKGGEALKAGKEAGKVSKTGLPNTKKLLK